MKIALFSDIHANLPALEACFKSIDEETPDFVYCLGDLVGYNVWPNEVINEIRKRNIPTIAGNYDQGVGIAGNDCGCAYKTDHDKPNGEQSIGYTNSVVKPDERTYLRNLPSHIRLEYNLTGEKFNLLMVHGSPRKINEYLFVDREDPRGCYVLMTPDDSFSLTDPESLKVEFIRFEYDTEKAAKAVEDSPLPNDFADMLRKGY